MHSNDTNHASRLDGLISRDELHRAITAGEITNVMIGFPDMMGRLKGKDVDPAAFAKDLPTLEACAYLLATDVNMTPLSGFELTGWDQGYGDVALLPDESAMRRLGYLDGTALVLADPVDHGGELLRVAPRHMLRHQLDRIAVLGFEVRVGLETEFVLYQDTEQSTARNRDLRPVTLHKLDYGLDRPPVLAGFLTELRNALRSSGMPAESVKLEGALGQVEVTFPYGPSLSACDAHVVFKHAVRHVAAQRGLTPTFMAAPETGVASGLHIHLSLWKDGEPVFATASRRDQLPETMRQAIAGLITGLPHLAPLYAPTVNSYKRYQPHSFAPTRFTWGIDNRTVAVRVTGHGQGTHLELRLPGADAEPHLAVAAACAAIHHGLTNTPALPPPYDGDAYGAFHELPVPSDLTAALGDFESPVAFDAFGENVVSHYKHAAEAEVMVHRWLVTDVERERGLERA